MPNAGSRLRFTWLGAPLVVLLSACAIATIPPPDAAEVARLEAAHQRDPNSPSTALALASAYRLTGRADEALPLLEEARAENPGDARVLLLLGTLREEQGDLDDALEAYRAYLEVEKRGRWPTEVARRIRLLQRKVMVAEAKRLVAQEAELADTEPQPGTVAVYPFLYRGNDPRLEPLGRALADLLTTDLSQTERLRVLERSRVQLLLDEMSLSQEGYVDPATAARSGRLLQAEHVVQGSLTGSGEDVELLATVMDVRSAESTGRVEERDALRRLFDAQRRLAIGIYERLGIQLTQAELDRIGQPPTQSLDALLAYGSALEAEDRGDFGAAAEVYRQAARLDPNFDAASQRAVQAAAMNRAQEVPTQAITVAVVTAVVDRTTPLVPDVGPPIPPEKPPAVEAFDVGPFGGLGILDIILSRPGTP